MGGEEIQGLDGEAEAAAFGEFADASADGCEAVTGDVGGAADERFTDIEDAVLVEAKTVAAAAVFGALGGGAFHDVLEVWSGEFEELLEHRRRLLLVQWPHRLRFLSRALNGASMAIRVLGEETRVLFSFFGKMGFYMGQGWRIRRSSPKESVVFF